MTIDVNVQSTDDAFLDEIDEIIEDTMVQMFFLQPRDAQALESAKEDAGEYSALFYAAPLALKAQTDANCIGYRVTEHTQLQSLPPLDKPLFVDEADLDDALQSLLIERGDQGVILGATHPHDALERFFIAIGPSNVDAFDPDALAQLSMERIVVQSAYPEHGFDEINGAVKTVSNAMFRPEESIIARATKQTLTLTGFKK
jgi:hypothetical protein